MSDLAPIVARLAALLGEPDGDPEPLDGGITNRNFRIRFGTVDYVVRVPGRKTDLLGIDRRAEWAAGGLADRAGVGPKLGAMLANPPTLVSRFIEGRELTVEDLQKPACLAELAAALRAVHGSGECLPTDFSPFRVVEEYAQTTRERGGEVPADYDPAHARAREIEEALTGPEHEPVPCHNDLLPANLIHDGERIRIVDWEYAGMGDRYFDLGNFAVNNNLDGRGEEVLVEAYFQEPVTARRLAALRLMRYASDFREAMWGVLQSTASDLDFDFEAYARRHFDRLAQTASHPSFGRWLEEARVSTA